MALRDYAECLPEGVFIKLGEFAKVGKEEDGKKVFKIKVCGRWVGIQLLKKIEELVNKGDVQEEITRVIRETFGVNTAEELLEEARKVIKGELKPYLELMDSRNHGTEGWLKALTFKLTTEAIRQSKLPIEMYTIKEQANIGPMP
ncbi:MAG: hypothetical protein QW733_03955 [Desulfurococcaceae archaeon]